jgi:hypothetical protein
MIRAVEEGLVMQQLLYAGEVDDEEPKSPRPTSNRRS